MTRPSLARQLTAAVLLSVAEGAIRVVEVLTPPRPAKPRRRRQGRRAPILSIEGATPAPKESQP